MALYASLDEEIQKAAYDLVALAKRKQLTFGTAESCTGGLVAGAITSVPGSSSVFMGSIVSYDLAVKERILGVDKKILYTPEIGAVSKECASQMLKAACELLSVDIALTVTGIAGPTGAEPHKPVGTVVFAVGNPANHSIFVKHFAGDRDEVRASSCLFAIEILREAIMK